MGRPQSTRQVSRAQRVEDAARPRSRLRSDATSRRARRATALAAVTARTRRASCARRASRGGDARNAVCARAHAAARCSRRGCRRRPAPRPSSRSSSRSRRSSAILRERHAVARARGAQGFNARELPVYAAAMLEPVAPARDVCPCCAGQRAVRVAARQHLGSSVQGRRRGRPQAHVPQERQGRVCRCRARRARAPGRSPRSFEDGECRHLIKGRRGRRVVEPRSARSRPRRRSRSARRKANGGVPDFRAAADARQSRQKDTPRSRVRAARTLRAEVLRRWLTGRRTSARRSEKYLGPAAATASREGRSAHQCPSGNKMQIATHTARRGRRRVAVLENPRHPRGAACGWPRTCLHPISRSPADGGTHTTHGGGGTRRRLPPWPTGTGATREVKCWRAAWITAARRGTASWPPTETHVGPTTTGADVTKRKAALAASCWHLKTCRDRRTGERVHGIDEAVHQARRCAPRRAARQACPCGRRRATPSRLPKPSPPTCARRDTRADLAAPGLDDRRGAAPLRPVESSAARGDAKKRSAAATPAAARAATAPPAGARDAGGDARRRALAP